MNIRYYNTYEDDFVESKNQNYKLKDNYRWIKNNIFYKIVTFIIYIPFLIYGFIYTKLLLRRWLLLKRMELDG